MSRKMHSLHVPLLVNAEFNSSIAKPDLQETAILKQRTFMRLAAVKTFTGISKSTLYLQIAQGLWPRPVLLGARAVGWPSEEADAIRKARVGGKTDTEIRNLVSKLVDARKV